MDDRLRTISDHWAYYQQALVARDATEIEAVIARFTRALGFRNYGYAEKPVASTTTTNPCRFFHDFSGEWGESYKTLHTPQAERSDPRILQARFWLPPAAWNSLGKSNYDLPSHIRGHARRKLMLAGEFGLHSGITIPMRVPGIDWAFVTFTTDGRTSPQELVPLLLSASYFASCVQSSCRRNLSQSALPTPALSEREREILRWSALGKTSWEISLIQRISERTINYHLANAARKLGVKGRRAAVAQALSLELIRL